MESPQYEGSTEMSSAHDRTDDGDRFPASQYVAEKWLIPVVDIRLHHRASVILPWAISYDAEKRLFNHSAFFIPNIIRNIDFRAEG